MDAISFVLGERPSHLRVKKLSVSVDNFSDFQVKHFLVFLGVEINDYLIVLYM